MNEIQALVKRFKEEKAVFVSDIVLDEIITKYFNLHRHYSISILTGVVRGYVTFDVSDKPLREDCYEQDVKPLIETRNWDFVMSAPETVLDYLCFVKVIPPGKYVVNF